MISRTKIKKYLQESYKLYKECPGDFITIDLLKYFFKWYNTLSKNSNPLKDKNPWLTFSAINFLNKVLTKEMIVYEYGIGGSTLFFFQRVKKIISIEHDPIWMDKVSEIIRLNKYNNWEGYLIEPKAYVDTIKNKDSLAHKFDSSTDPSFIGKSFEEYASSIERYPDNYFDIILLDGRARVSCFYHAVKKIKHKGFIILDNAERDEYSYIHESLNNDSWVKLSCYGPGPYVSYFWQTCIWQKS